MAATKVVNPNVTGDWNLSESRYAAMTGEREISGPAKVALKSEAKSILVSKDFGSSRQCLTRGGCVQSNGFGLLKECARDKSATRLILWWFAYQPYGRVVKRYSDPRRSFQQINAPTVGFATFSQVAPAECHSWTIMPSLSNMPFAPNPRKFDCEPIM